MGPALQRLRALSPGQRRQLAGMVVALPLVHGALAVLGFARTRRWLERMSRHATARPATPADLEAARAASRLVAIAGRRGAVSATCLRQSLYLYWLLRRRGLRPQLLLGVDKPAGVFAAHAWIELEGRSLDVAPHRHRAFRAPGASPGE